MRFQIVLGTAVSTAVSAAWVLGVAACGGGAGAEDAAIDATPGCVADPLPPGVLTGQRLILGDTARTYALSVPDDLPPATPAAVVLVFHGEQSSSTDVRALLALETVAGEPALFVYPDAQAPGWELATAGEGNRDVALVAAILDDLDARACLDRTRVFATGFATGASFVNQLACARGDLLRGIAPISGDGPAGETRDPAGQLVCPSAPPPAFVVHGNDDAIVPNPVDGSAGGRASYRHWAYWAHAEPREDYDLASEDVPPAPCLRAVGLPEDHEVYGCFIDGLAHAPWPTAAGSIRAFFASRR